MVTQPGHSINSLGIPAVGRDVLCFHPNFFVFLIFFFFFFYSTGTNLGLAVANLHGWLSYLE